MLWSPDGASAVWRVGSRVAVLDEQGKPRRELNHSTGGFAWSADARTLYFSAVAEGASPVSVEDCTGEGPSTRPTTLPIAVVSSSTVQRLRDGKIDSLIALPATGYDQLSVSPDQNWLAMRSVQPGGRGSLYAYSIRQRRLLLLSRRAGSAVCFAGPAEIAFVESPADPTKPIGQLVRLRLDDAPGAQPVRKIVAMDVATSFTPAITPDRRPGELLMTAMPIDLPGKPNQLDAGAFRLFHVSLGDGGMTALTEDIGPIVRPAPGGDRLLLEKWMTQSGATLRQLCVMNANGSGLQPIRDVTKLAAASAPLPMAPAWRGKDEIAFVDDTHANRFDVLLYRLSDRGQLSPLRTLSADWPDEFRPARDATTRPTSSPMP